MRKYLPRNAYHRRAVNERIGQAGHKVGGARPAGGQHHAHPARAARIPLRRMNGPLLVAHQHVVELLLEVVERVVNRDNGPAGVAKNRVYLLGHQRLQRGYRARGGRKGRDGRTSGGLG